MTGVLVFSFSHYFMPQQQPVGGPWPSLVYIPYLCSNCPNRSGLKSRGCTEAGRALLELVAHSFWEYGGIGGAFASQEKLE